MNINKVEQSLNDIKNSNNRTTKSVYNFVQDLVSQNNIKNLQNIVNVKDYRYHFSIPYKPIRLIPKEKLLLDKLLNNKYKDIICINTVLHFKHMLSTEIFYYITVNDDLFSTIGVKLLKHKLKKDTGKYKIINEYREIDITNDYLNNIFSVSENMRDRINGIKLAKITIVNFINMSTYNKKIKKESIKLTNTLPDNFIALDLFAIYKKIYTRKVKGRPIVDFMNLIFNNIFEKSIHTDLLDYDSKNIPYTGIIKPKIVKKFLFFNEQYKILEEII